MKLKYVTIDEVVFAQPGDLEWLGARSLEGLNLRVDGRAKKLVAGVRFSCPSAAANSGKALSDQIPALRELAELVVPDGFTGFPAPAVLQEAGLDWPDFMRFVSWLDKTMSPENKPVALKLQRALHWLDALAFRAFIPAAVFQFPNGNVLYVIVLRDDGPARFENDYF